MCRVSSKEDAVLVDVGLCAALVEPDASQPPVLDDVEFGVWVETGPRVALEFLDGQLAIDLVEVFVGRKVVYLDNNAVHVIGHAKNQECLLVHSRDGPDFDKNKKVEMLENEQREIAFISSTSCLHSVFQLEISVNNAIKHDVLVGECPTGKLDV